MGCHEFHTRVVSPRFVVRVFQIAVGSILCPGNIRTGDEIRETNSPNSNGVVIQQVFSSDSHAFSNARQSRGRLNRLIDSAATLDTAVFWFSALTCLVLAWTKCAERVNLFFYSAIVFLVINAAICATLAGVYDRYQSRVAWLVPFCLMSYLCCLVRERKRAIS